MSREGLRRLLTPASVAVAGGEVAAEVIRQCRKIGFAGPIWAVNPRRREIEGVPAFASVDDLPEVPDATFVAVPREQTIEVVRALARRGAPGAICYASGFSEVGGDGVSLQRELVEAAGSMALLGPNCYGFINYLDGCALWPDHLGGTRVPRGVAILTQSGNIALNLTMQAHHLPIAYMITIGNKAVTDVDDFLHALLEDGRVTAIGLHVEALGDIAAFARAATAADVRRVPIVALKAGSSEIGAQLAASHTRSLSGPDVLYSALFRRLGIARVEDPVEFLETLKLLHACGPISGARLGSMSCSGGDASLVADIGLRHGLEFPALTPALVDKLSTTLGPLVPINNPLDYQTYIWGDEPALTACFSTMMEAPLDVCQVVLDFPTLAPVPIPGWDEVVNAFIAAHLATQVAFPKAAILVSSLPELLPEHVARRLLDAGIAPMQGLRETVAAIAAAAEAGARRRAGAAPPPLAPPVPLRDGPTRLLDEADAKAALAAHGVRIPRGASVTNADAAAAAAERIGYPVVVKALDERLAHKSDVGAVHLDLADAFAVRAAVAALAPRFDRFLVEEMVRGGLAELIVGVTRDAQFGHSLTIGAGGILVELLADSATLLLPATRSDIECALRGLRSFALLDGYRGKPRADLAMLIDAIAAIAAFAQDHSDRLVELDVNPLIVTSGGAIAVDALARIAGDGALARTR